MHLGQPAGIGTWDWLLLDPGCQALPSIHGTESPSRAHPPSPLPQTEQIIKLYVHTAGHTTTAVATLGILAFASLHIVNESRLLGCGWELPLSHQLPRCHCSC